MHQPFLFLNACTKDDNEAVVNLEAPIANAPKDVNDTGFRAKWNYVSNSKSYLLDVSTSENFATFVPNYESKPVTDLNEVVVGLTGGTQYYYKLKPETGAQISDYSNVISVVRLAQATFLEDPTFLKVKANKLANPFCRYGS